MIINTLWCHLSLVTFAFTLDLGQLEGVSYGCAEILPREYSFISWAHDAAHPNHSVVYFNRQNNDDLILAVQSAGVERGRNGFRKNKSTEKNPESEEDLLEHRTDGTDAFDTLYIGCEKFPQHDFYGVAVGGVR